MAVLSSAARPLLRLRTLRSCVPHRFASSSSSATTTSSKQVTSRVGTSSQSPISKLNIPTPKGPSPQPGKGQQPSIPTLEGPVSQFIRELPPHLAKKQWYAQKLYDAGTTAIYRPPSHFGIYAAAFVIGSSAIGVAGILAYGNLWAWEGDPDLPWFVPVAHRLGIFVFSAVGWLIMMRSLRIIKAIDLVPVDGVVKMAVQVRRPLPFLRPKQFLIEPYRFQMDNKFVQQLAEPDFIMANAEAPSSTNQTSGGLVPSIVRAISKAIYYPFASTRRLMTLEGFMMVNFEGSRGKMKLDTQGLFSNAAEDLIQMGTTRL
ncbi:uncharacterized protein Z520_10639 [Fonsecaea multimorphosa CBS 102226]|uniref:Uncharacterized protein n=1 Tax=Fonsecaea multimorphosa CBS 102226 TaxID=1442371 RepID=A0A0D2KAZ4_9EURO|nr:uncharacterized protein Z520_10639 [Fonsecaea multimorphosa CBS 102226]KIX93733.1 hypothetical protein Z520_10639 [Fonsecaea multimorphosa CBS 102226]OAL19841.1 hypothetical protein AYO22_09368 [Fonsecaea multimorphosa]